LRLVFAQVAGVGQQERCGTARGEDAVVGLDAALGDVAGQEVGAAGVSQRFDFLQ